jgi:hypothetical protein
MVCIGAVQYLAFVAAANEAADDGGAAAEPAGSSSGGTSTAASASAAGWGEPAEPATQSILPPATSILITLFYVSGHCFLIIFLQSCLRFVLLTSAICYINSVFWKKDVQMYKDSKFSAALVDVSINPGHR